MSRVDANQQRQAAPAVRFGRDQRGNMQIVETMVVALLVVGAVVAVSTMDVPVTRTEGFKDNNEQLVDDTLTAMAGRPTDGAQRTLFGSILEEYVMEAIAGNTNPLHSHLNKTLPAGSSFNVLVDNGYGRPVTLIESGKPPGEAVAGSVQFVPKLAYTFMVSDFGEYHGDFHMNALSMPISNGALLHDEGDTLELAVTVKEVAAPGEDEKDPVTIRSYGHTALVKNDPALRQWPSVAMYHDAGTSNHFVDASNVPAELDPGNWGLPGSGGGSLTGDVYNITFPVRIDETAGVKVPKNTMITVEFPRLWDLNEAERDYLANNTDLGNQKYWKDFTFEGDWTDGITVTAKLRESFYDGNPNKPGHVWFNVSAFYGALIDTAYPYFSPITITLGDGVQGQSTIVVKPPGANAFGVLRREPYLSLSKPTINGDTTIWGATFTNMGMLGTDQIEVQSITLRQPQGLPIFRNLNDLGESVSGSWSYVGPGEYTWTPDSTYVLSSGQAAWLSFTVDGGNTENNHYRQENYLDVSPRFNPDNTTGSNSLGTWEYLQRSRDMNEEWVYRVAVPPSDGDPTGYIPGWPDEMGNDYWVTGGTTIRAKHLAGNFSYHVIPTSLGSNTFGSYQGSHTASSLDIVDQTLTEKRDFALGDKVHIKNDFSALFGELSALDEANPFSVTNLKIDSYVYTPEKAWKGIPTKSYSTSASVIALLEDIRFLEAADLDGDGTQDLVTVDSGGLVYGMDGRDGTKFWTHDLRRNVASVAVGDLDADGNVEVYVGHDDGHLSILDGRPTLPPGAQRSLHTEDLNDVGAPGIGDYDVLDIVVLTANDPTRPELAVTMSADSLDGLVHGVDIVNSGGSWSATKSSTYDQSDTTRSTDVRYQDLEPVWIDAPKSGPPTHVAAASDNMTVTLLSATDLSQVVWVTDVPEMPRRILAADLDEDGADDLVVNSYEDALGGSGGTDVYTISGRTGNWASKVRDTDNIIDTIDPFEAKGTADGGIFVVNGDEYVLQDTTGMYTVGVQWPNLDDSQGASEITDILGVRWGGLHHGQKDEIFVIAHTGEIRVTTEQRVIDGYNWDRVTNPSPDITGTYMDLFVPPDYQSGGTIYAMDEGGFIHYLQDPDTYKPVASLCPSPGIPDAGVTCTSGVDPYRWEVVEDGNGHVTHFVVAVNDDDASPKTASLYEYDLAGSTWTQLASWDNKVIKDMHRASNGTWYVAGASTGTAVPFAATSLTGSTWTTQQFLAPTGSLTSILAATDGATFASGDQGRVWKWTGGNLWVPYPVEGLTTEPTVLVEDAGGHVQVIGRNFENAPLYQFKSQGYLYFAPFHADLADGFKPTLMTIQAEEGHLGGTDGAERAHTWIQWSYRLPGEVAWTTIPAIDLPRDDVYNDFYYNATLLCNSTAECEGIEVRADMRTRTLSDGLSTMRRDASASPMIRNVNVTLSDALTTTWEVIEPSQANMTGSSSSIYSEAHKGWVLPHDPRPTWWHTSDINAYSPATGDTRRIGVSDASVVTGTGPPSVIVTESGSTGFAYAFNGTTGHLLTSPTSSPFITEDDDITDGLLVIDMDADGIEDVVGAGIYDDEVGATRTWYVDQGTIRTTDTVSGSTVRDLVATGTWKQRQTLAYVTSDDTITSVNGTSGSGAPAWQWQSNPGGAQGKATFIYEIPNDALFGTGFVVSELKFDIDDGATVTQTARVLNWFNITPPNDVVPRPPIYTVEIVSWFNEV